MRHIAKFKHRNSGLRGLQIFGIKLFGDAMSIGVRAVGAVGRMGRGGGGGGGWGGGGGGGGGGVR